MTIPKRTQFEWKGAREGWRRLGQATQRARAKWLRSLSEEESIAIFEDLCQGIPELEGNPRPDAPPPVVLSSLWKSG